MRNFSNTYIFVFSAIMVVTVAALLSFVALQLKPKQDKNVRVEKMQNILSSIHIESTPKNVEEQYNKYITNSLVVDYNGEVLKSANAFKVDMVEELDKINQIVKLKEKMTDRVESPFKKMLNNIIPKKQINIQSVKDDINDIKSERELPVFIGNKDGQSYYIFPMRGKGLWGPIWGYVALEDDMNTIYGAVFDHKSETPGLGAEIKEKWFRAKFEGKKIFSPDGVFQSIKVVKGGATSEDDYAVDGISGGTITSKGLEGMLEKNLNGYKSFFESKRIQ